MHTHAVCLHDGRLAVAVDDQSGQVVAFSVYESVGVVVGIVGNADADAHVESGLQAFVPERFVDGPFVEREHAHGDASDLVVSRGDVFSACGYHAYGLTFLNAVVAAGNGTRKHPWMKASEAFFLPLFQLNGFVAHVVLSS